MPKPFTYFIGLRYLWTKKQGFVSVISFLTVAGIVVGVSALIIVISVMSGFREDMRDKIIGTNAHVVVGAYSKEGIKNYRVKIKEIKKLDHVVSAAPYYFGQVMLKYGENVEGLVLWGVNPDSISKVNELKKNIIKGDIDFITKDLPDNRKGILLGKELMSLLGAELGDEVILISPVFIRTPTGMVPKMNNMKIVGVFEAGMYDYDTTFSYVSIDTAQKLFDKGDVVTGIGIKTDKLENAVGVASEIHRKFHGLWARDWMSMNKNLFAAVKMEKFVMFIILTLIIAVAAFNVASTLIMMVMRKTKDIGILKSMGATNRDIMNIFIIQGVVTAVVGTLLGFAIGVGICFYLQAHPVPMPGGGSIYYIDKLPVSMDFVDLSIIGVATIIISFLATLYPAYQASKLDPVEAIRYE